MVEQAERDEVDIQGRTALHHAAIGGHLEIIGLLILAEFDTCLEDSLGNLAIHYIASGGFEKCLKPLLKAGSRVDSKNKMGSTPLHLVIKHHIPSFFSRNRFNLFLRQV